MKSKIILITSIIIILAINSLLPMLKAIEHYTVAPEEMTYKEYKDIKEENKRYDLTFKTKTLIKEYKKTKKEELTSEEMLTLEPPEDMRVEVYTKFFFEDHFWYTENFVQVISAVILFYSIFQFFLLKETEENVEFRKAKKQVDDANEKSVEPDSLEEFLVNDFNRPRKIKQHINNIKNKIIKLENKTKTEIKISCKEELDWFKQIKNTEAGKGVLPALIEQPRSKKEIKYLKEMKKLLAELKEDYIEEYIDAKKVKHYKDVTSNFVYTGNSKTEKSIDGYSAIKTDSERLKKDSYKKIGLMILITLSFATVITLLAVDIENKTPFEIIVNAIMKITPLLLQIKFGLDYKDDFMQTQLISNMKQRHNIIVMFLKHTNKGAI